MVRQDYIIRMIEKFGEILREIVSKTSAEHFEEAKQDIAQTCEELVGVGIDDVCSTADSKLVAKLLRDRSPQEGRDRLYMLIALLNVAGGNHLKQGLEEKHRAHVLKALNLMLTIGGFTDEEVTPEYAPKVDHLLQQLDGVPAKTLVGLMQFYESHNELGKAEDRLFELIDLVENKQPAIELGSAFLHRQLAKSDEELVTGNLPREEVEEGLGELDRLAAKG